MQMAMQEDAAVFRTGETLKKGRSRIDEIYKQIEEELRNQYSMGYTPGAESGAGYHKIVLRTNQKDQTVQARDGYYADR